jgi:hypothetical protein
MASTAWKCLVLSPATLHLEMSGLVACHAALGQQCDVVLSSRVDTIVVLDK